MPGPKIPKPKLDMNMSLLMLGLVILVLGNVYYTYRQFNEINQRLNNLNINKVENNLSNNNDDKDDDELPDVETFAEQEPLKNIFINNTNDKVSENIVQEIKIVENNEVNNEVNNEDNEEEVNINFNELDNDLDELNFNNENPKLKILNNKSKKDLIDLAEENNLSKSGTKSELVNRLLESDIDVEE